MDGKGEKRTGEVFSFRFVVVCAGQIKSLETFGKGEEVALSSRICMNAS